mgnify:CR=1 FL=1
MSGGSIGQIKLGQHGKPGKIPLFNSDPGQGMKLFLCLGVATIIFVADILLPSGLAGGQPYVLVVLMAVWSRNIQWTFTFAVLGTVLNIVVLFTGVTYLDSDLYIALANRLFAILIIWVLQIILIRNIKAKQSLEKHKIELELLTNELMQRMNAVNLSAIISETDVKGNIIFVNDKFCEISGYSRDELIGQNHRLLKSGKHPEGLFVGMWKSISLGNTWQGEIINKKKNGDLYWVATTIAPFKNLKGNIIKFISVRFDITKEKQQQKKLKESLKREKDLTELKSRFVSNASHQFRTPLTIIQSSLGLLESHSEFSSEASKKRFQKSYTRIKEQIERMTELMNDVLILGKISSKEISPVKNEFDLVRQCEILADKYAKSQDDGRAIDIRIEGTERNITLDQTLMVNALSNILNNAFKYSKGCPNPEMLIEFKKGSVSISVTDFGVGIPEKDINRIFESFYRSPNAIQFPGKGLGLTMVEEYVKLNNGEINLTSKEKEQTTITITYKTS